MPLPERESLHHEVPSWVQAGACFFVTICACPRGTNQLTHCDSAAKILASVDHYHRAGTWWVHLFLLMPDHAHALIAVAPNKSLTTTLRAWKSWQTKTLGIQWQAGFFDHRIRSHESLEEKAHYIRANPVRAGLIAHPEEWPHVWRPSPSDFRDGSPRTVRPT